MNKLKILFILLMLAITNYSNAQIVTLDYSSYSSNDCDVFGNAVPVQGILHETKRGDVTKNSSQGALGLQFNYNNNSQKGTEYSIFGGFSLNNIFIIFVL